MTHFVDDLVSIYRFFGAFERDAICCGTVTTGQCFVLQALLQDPSDNSSLARQARLSDSAMTRLVDGLARRGYIERQRDKGDRRRVLIALTEEGRIEAERLHELTKCSIGAVLDAVPAAKRGQVIESLGLLREALDKARITCC